VTRVLLLAALAAVCACGAIADGGVDLLIDGEGDHGTVYVCNSGAMCVGGTEEWCWNGAEEDLEAHLGANCHRIRFDERAWPALVGCAYGCPLAGAGANAHCGAFCPPGGVP
jgi:hypothetical protein